ncbi:RNA polymerase sigma factor [Frondihabitans australicus]|uniref:RNA polymerase sigma-70 factor (ECF subfamily) n=1 Tax=Frondihabitans australicus TaxID=386892 RepID=A0A495IG38_9MICO|nr:sigma-70 family RNA polymerase sigma factor [Frondihabitans australicus]RKR74368.1 RNA polymerase sigma-70 factor (ECF subfamily) [Frondihabitans australicus]
MKRHDPPGERTRDGELVEMASHGGGRRARDAFRVLFDRHSSAVLRYAWGLAANRSDVDDLVQETFLVAWRRRSDIRVVAESALPWLLTTCRNASLNLNRARLRSEAHELVEEPHNGPASYRRRDHDEAQEQVKWVVAEIAALPDLDRRLCQLCLIEGRSYEEAAAFLDLTPASARKRIQRTRDRLRAARAADC